MDTQPYHLLLLYVTFSVGWARLGRLARPLLYPLDQATNPSREEGKMRTDGQTLRGNEMDMGKVKAWAKRTFSKERTSVVSCELVVAGYIGVVLAQVFLTY